MWRDPKTSTGWEMLQWNMYIISIYLYLHTIFIYFHTAYIYIWSLPYICHILPYIFTIYIQHTYLLPWLCHGCEVRPQREEKRTSSRRRTSAEVNFSEIPGICGWTWHLTQPEKKVCWLVGKSTHLLHPFWTFFLVYYPYTMKFPISPSTGSPWIDRGSGAAWRLVAWEGRFGSGECIERNWRTYKE